MAKTGTLFVMDFTKKPINQYKLKPFKIPEDMVVIQDTREQKPLFRRPPKGLIIQSDTLTDGDYSIKGFTDKFTVERKQISDFYSYIGKERKKTEEKLQRLSRFQFAALVIEATETEILMGYDFCKLSPECARQALVSFEIRYGLHTYYSNSRHDIARWILDRMIKFWKVAHEVQ